MSKRMTRAPGHHVHAPIEGSGAERARGDESRPVLLRRIADAAQQHGGNSDTAARCAALAWRDGDLCSALRLLCSARAHQSIHDQMLQLARQVQQHPYDDVTHLLATQEQLESTEALQVHKQAALTLAVQEIGRTLQHVGMMREPGVADPDALQVLQWLQQTRATQDREHAARREAQDERLGYTPRRMSARVPDSALGARVQPGQVWQTPNGVLCKVLRQWRDATGVRNAWVLETLHTTPAEQVCVDERTLRQQWHQIPSY